MMLALDEGVGNVTSAYKSLGIWNDTVRIKRTAWYAVPGRGSLGGLYMSHA